LITYSLGKSHPIYRLKVNRYLSISFREYDVADDCELLLRTLSAIRFTILEEGLSDGKEYSICFNENNRKNTITKYDSVTKYKVNKID